MSGFDGTPPQFAKALVMASLLGAYYAQHGKADPPDIAKASAIADAILHASEGRAPSAIVPAPQLAAAMSTGAMRHMGGGVSLPSMPSPPGNPAHMVPSTPGANPSPPLTPSQLPYSGQPMHGAGLEAPESPTSQDPLPGARVLDLSQPR